MLSIERDPAFWRGLMAEPVVLEHTMLGLPLEALDGLVASPAVTPLACADGGFLLRNLDGLGLVEELHAVFRTRAWGRPVLAAMWDMYAIVFRSAHVLVVSEQDGWWRSAPPKSHGWRPAAGFAPTVAGSLRTWVLTHRNWTASVAYLRRMR